MFATSINSYQKVVDTYLPTHTLSHHPAKWYTGDKRSETIVVRPVYFYFRISIGNVAKHKVYYRASFVGGKIF